MTRRRSSRQRLAALAALVLVLGTSGVSGAAGPPAVPDLPSQAKQHRPAFLPGTEIGQLPSPPRPPVSRPTVHRVVPALPGEAQVPEPPAPLPRASRSRTALRTAATTTTAAAAATTTVTGSGLSTAKKTLVLYDSTSEWGWLGELYAQQSANLASHFGSWTTAPVTSYTAGQVNAYDAVIYVGSTYDEPVPPAFLTDVSTTGKQVVWMYNNIWQLSAADPTFATRQGWSYKQYDFSSVSTVGYKDRDLVRYADNAAGIMDVTITDPVKARVLATAKRGDGTSFPWAVRSGNFTYIGEVPYSYVQHGDRYLAASDMLFDALAPGTPERHRALVRIEDVGPDADPAELRAIADLLSSQQVPFSVTVYTRFLNPLGIENGGVAQAFNLSARPEVISALKYMQSKGGTLVMHGWTHQFGSLRNPYDGLSGNDFEFFLAHEEGTDPVRVVYDGPVPGDSPKWANDRIQSSATQFTNSGLTVPRMWTFPHYAGSAVDYRAVANFPSNSTTKRFTARYERGLYFGGLLTGGTVNHSRLNGQYFPYAVKDLYGTKVVPENIGNIEPVPYNTHPVRLPADLEDTARANLVVRDGFASFFYHPYLGTSYLKDTVARIKALGYTFVAAGTV